MTAASATDTTAANATTDAPRADRPQEGTLRAIGIASWVTRLVVAGIFAMGALPKFTGGAAELAERIPGGAAAVTAIGVIELVVLVLLLVPRTALIGAIAAAAVMFGAIASHFGPVGTDGDFATMLVLAIVAFIAADTTAVLLFLRRRFG